MREGISLVFFNLQCSCNILYLGQNLQFTGRDNIWCGSEWDNNGSFYSLPNLLLRWDRKYYSSVNTTSLVATSSQHHIRTSVQRKQIGFVRISLLPINRDNPEYANCRMGRSPFVYLFPTPVILYFLGTMLLLITREPSREMQKKSLNYEILLKGK